MGKSEIIMSKVCPSCLQRVDESSAKTCPYCGEILDADIRLYKDIRETVESKKAENKRAIERRYADDNPTASNKQDDYDDNITPVYQKKSSPVFAVIFVLVIVIAVGFYVYNNLM